MTRLTLYSRSWCHLCDDMLAALRALPYGHTLDIDLVDVDADESLTALYDELVPVLAGTGKQGDPVTICHYFLDKAALERFLASIS